MGKKMDRGEHEVGGLGEASIEKMLQRLSMARGQVRKLEEALREKGVFLDAETLDMGEAGEKVLSEDGGVGGGVGGSSCKPQLASQIKAVPKGRRQVSLDEEVVDGSLEESYWDPREVMRDLGYFVIHLAPIQHLDSPLKARVSPNENFHASITSTATPFPLLTPPATPQRKAYRPHQDMLSAKEWVPPARQRSSILCSAPRPVLRQQPPPWCRRPGRLLACMAGVSILAQRHRVHTKTPRHAPQTPREDHGSVCHQGSTQAKPDRAVAGQT